LWQIIDDDDDDILSWGHALGPLGGLGTGQLNCCLPRMEEKRRERDIPV